jgi:uncharacterized delta-60 repeat protein
VLHLFLAHRACGQAADWDNSWDPGTGPNDVVFSLLEQPDGRVLIAGTFTAVNGAPRSHVARLNADGSVDSSFDPGQGPDSLVLALARQPDGKVVIGGFFTKVGGIARNRIARLNADGSLDAQFDPGSGVGDNSVDGLAVQPDGRIIIVGAFATVNGLARNGIARLNPDGTLDGSFNPGTGADFVINAVALDATNRILAGGYFSQFNGVARNGVVRVNPDGSLDNSFVPGIAAYPAVETLVLQPDGKLLVGGGYVASGGVTRRLARLNTDGSVDLSFNPGTGFTGPASAYYTAVRSLAVQADGKILVGGNFTGVNGVEADRFARLNPNGSLDTGFDPGSFGPPSDSVCVCALGLQSDAKILLGGYIQTINGVSRPNVARLLPGESQPAGRLEFSSDEVSVSESAGNATLTVVRLGNATGTVTVNYATRDYSALGGEDFVPTSGTLTFAAGETTKSFQVPIINDSLVETGEGFSVELSSPTGGARLGVKSSAAIFIADDDTNVEFGSPTYLVTENQTNALITVERHGAFLGRTTVDYVATNGTATAGADFVAVSGTLIFDVGEQSKSFSVPILQHPVDNGNETILLTLSHPSPPVTLGHQASAVLTIAEVGVVDASFNTGTGPDGRVESLAPYPGGKIMIQGSFIGNVNGIPRPGLARINADGSLDSGFVPQLSDAATAMAVSADGLVYVLSGIGTGVHIDRLLPDGSRDGLFMAPYFTDDVPLAVQPDGKLLMNRIDSNFSNPPGLVTNRVLRLNHDGSVDSSFAQDTWIEHRLTFRPGISVLKIQADGKLLVGGSFTHVTGLERKGLARFQPDGSLDPAFNAALGGWGSVLSLDLLPDGRIFIAGDFDTVHAVPRAKVALLNPDGTLDATFDFAVDPSSSAFAVLALPVGKVLVTGNFTATNRLSLGSVLRLNANGSIDTDFYSTTDCCVFSLALQGDGKVLLAGSFFGFQGTPRNYLARLKTEPGSGAGVVEFVSPTLSVNEAGRSLDVRIRRVGESYGAVLVPFATMDGTASAGADYTPQASAITFTNGELGEKTITIPILHDTLAEGDETFSVNLGSPIGGAVWGTQAATSVTIIDDDVALDFTTNWFRVHESQGGQLVQVRRFGSTSGTVSVKFATSDGTGKAGVNYIPQSGTLFYSEGETNKTFVIPILDDWMAEEDRTLFVSLSQASGTAQLGTNSPALVTILGSHRPGTIDESFDPGFGLPQDNFFAQAQVDSLAVQSDGRILVGGSFDSFDRFPQPSLVRLFPDGSVDTNYLASVPRDFSGPSAVTIVRLQPDGKAVAVTTSESGSSKLIRFTTNGLLDTSFDASALMGRARALELQLDGKIVLGGSFTDTNGVQTGCERLHSDGSLDTSFLPGSLGSDSGFPGVTCLALDSDGRIVVGGSFATVGTVSRHGLARLTANGILDLSFDPGAGLADESGTHNFAYPSALAVQGDGKIIVGGFFAQVNGSFRTNIARLNPDGSLDSAFNASVAGPFGLAPVSALAVQQDNRLLIAGIFSTVNGVPRNGIARLQTDGSLDTQFHSSQDSLGLISSSYQVQVYAIALQPDGQILVGGKFSMVDGESRSGVARLNGTQLSPNHPVLNIVNQANGKFKVRFTGATGQTYFVLVSTNLTDWVSLGRPAEPTIGLFEFEDPNADKFAQRFYRVFSP